MKSHLNKVKQYIKKNPVTMSAVALVFLATGGVILYSQSNQSALQRKQLDSDAQLASQIENSKKSNGERLAKIAEEKKAAEEEAAKKAAEEKAAAEAAAAAAAEKKAAAIEAAQQATSDSITLSSGAPIAYDGKTKIPVNWSAGFTSEKGFKLVWNTTGSPTYPGSDYQYFDKSSSTGSGYVKAFTPGTYYIRVCQYLGGSCGVYSNQIVVTIP
ncbi:hypothetical protein KDA00_02500 [Candidatus Saccharibacteria bacterium]|nr:hypothetical protein [Candidatus Saccharibacteria bacterium]